MKYDFYNDINMLNNNYRPNNDFNGQFMDINGSLMNFNNNSNQINNNSLNLYGPYDAYIRGNSFKDEYVPYKNYQPAKVKINNEKEELLFNIGEYSFIAHDLNLYLDTHPNNQMALNMFIEYRNKANELINNYERKYGPLNISGVNDDKIPFSWVASEWPWGN